MTYRTWKDPTPYVAELVRSNNLLLANATAAIHRQGSSTEPALRARVEAGELVHVVVQASTYSTEYWTAEVAPGDRDLRASLRFAKGPGIRWGRLRLQQIRYG